LLTKPAIASWAKLVAPASGEIFGKSLEYWRSSTKKTFGLPDKPIIVTGHQPEFFHTGVLAKFLASNTIAKEVDGILVHLVVDHHIGQSGVIELPDDSGDYLSTKFIKIAEVDSNIAMKDQNRVEPMGDNVFSNALRGATGENLAMQFANATSNLMSEQAEVDYCIAGTTLLRTEFGKLITEHMREFPEHCIETYNNAIDQFPSSKIAKLNNSELPLWQGKTNEKVGSDNTDLRPRALLLTLLARLLLGDLFVHGTGGYEYDKIMETWVKNWLHVSPCAKVLATDDKQLPLSTATIEQARRTYFSPPQHFLVSINNAPRGSSERKLHYLAMHKWLAERNQKPNISALKKAKKIVCKRDWAFPLFEETITKDFLVPKSFVTHL
jgi:hypothetical protein